MHTVFAFRPLFDWQQVLVSLPGTLLLGLSPLQPPLSRGDGDGVCVWWTVGRCGGREWDRGRGNRYDEREDSEGCRDHC